jgi:NIMA (never in mitosis gene a)-related kinase
MAAIMGPVQPKAPQGYDVGMLLGKGTFGEVYLVVDAATGIKYVLKRVKLARQTSW